MIVLLIDQGNSNTKYAWCEILDNSCLSKDIQIHSINQQALTDLKPDKVLMASVADDTAQQLVKNQVPIQNLTQDIQLITTPTQAYGLTNAYQAYTRLGVDRWLAMLGARILTNQTCIVLDAGTAVTLDVIDNIGMHQGGWILPSVHFSAESLAKRAGKIELQQINPASTALGKITEDCVYNGLYASHIQLIKSQYLTHKALSENENVEVFIAGGDSEIYQTLLAEEGVDAKIEDNLVFLGMLEYLELNLYSGV